MIDDMLTRWGAETSNAMKVASKALLWKLPGTVRMVGVFFSIKQHELWALSFVSYQKAAVGSILDIDSMSLINLGPMMRAHEHLFQTRYEDTTKKSYGMELSWISLNVDVESANSLGNKSTCYVGHCTSIVYLKDLEIFLLVWHGNQAKSVNTNVDRISVNLDWIGAGAVESVIKKNAKQWTVCLIW